MNFGPEIKVDGKRPAWLRNDVLCMVKWLAGNEGGPYPTDCVSGWEHVEHIRLPADHFAYNDDGYVRVKKMTEGEAREYALKHGYADYLPNTVHYIGALHDLGIITESPVERFKRENPGLTADELLAKALENGND